MLQAVNTKILLAILAALVGIGGYMVHQNQVSERLAADAAKTRALLEQQQKATDDQQRANDETRRKVEAEKKKSRAWNTGGSKSLNYIP